MQLLLNISTFNENIFPFQNNWQEAEDFVKGWGFDGYELYPVGKCSHESIPPGLIKGIHMRFFPFISPIWENDEERLLEIFGNWETVDYHYGGRDAAWITECYSDQLNLAEKLGCPYVVFHPVQCEPEYVYNWKFPWTVKDTLDLFSEVVNSALKSSSFSGSILFENLWWPGSFRLDGPWEYDYLLSKINHPLCGITLDTGHLMNKNPYIKDENEAVEYILSSIDELGSVSRSIKNVHLNKSLSGDYVLQIRNNEEKIDPDLENKNGLSEIYNHVMQIDLHEPFENSVVSSIFEKIDPDTTVFEFIYRDMNQWQDKISVQKEALYCYFWEERKLNRGNLLNQNLRKL